MVCSSQAGEKLPDPDDVRIGSGGFQLSLANGMPDFNAGDRTPGRPTRLKRSNSAWSSKN